MSNDGGHSRDRHESNGFFSRLRNIFRKPVEEEDVVAALEQAKPSLAKGLTKARREMIERVIAFDETKVVDVMAPRADIFAVDMKTSIEDLIAAFAEAGHSRMPVYRGDLDDPVGMVHIKDVVGIIADRDNGGSADGHLLQSIRREILYVPPSMRITDLLLRMQASRIHMALVIDEYGGTDGLVTIEDLVEEIVGEINDEHDEDDAPAISARSGGGWEVDARVELQDFEEETGIQLEADDDEIDTVGGLVVSLAGRVPQRGEVLSDASRFDYEITEADARKVRKLLIRPTAKPSEAAE